MSNQHTWPHPGCGQSTLAMADVGRWLRAGWLAVVANLGAFILLGLLWFAAMGLAGQLNGVLPLLLLGPATAAAYAVALGAVRNGRADFSSLDRVGPSLLQAALVGIVVSLLVAAGFLFLVIPGVIAAALYLFPLLLVVDRRASFWDAMEQSREEVQRDLLGFSGFVLALAGINVLGLICCGVGVLISFPVTLCAVSAAYEELWSRRPGAPEA